MFVEQQAKQLPLDTKTESDSFGVSNPLHDKRVLSPSEQRLGKSSMSRYFSKLRRFNSEDTEHEEEQPRIRQTVRPVNDDLGDGDDDYDDDDDDRGDDDYDEGDEDYDEADDDGNYLVVDETGAHHTIQRLRNFNNDDEEEEKEDQGKQPERLSSAFRSSGWALTGGFF